MDEENVLEDVRYLRDVVEKTQPPMVNRFWPVTLGWGCLVTMAYLICWLLAMEGKMAVLPWVWPVLMCGVGWPMNWYLVRRVRAGIEQGGVRPRCRKDLMLCWMSIVAMGMLWSAGLAISGMLAQHWYVLFFVWGSLYFVGYVMNGVLVSAEWYWAAGVLLVSLIAAFAAGPRFYWLAGVWVGGTLVLAGLLGRRNARRLAAAA
jgi:hypothetical protein